MNLCSRSLRVLAFVAFGCWSSTISLAEEIARWDFHQEPIGWEPNAETELSLQEGQLKVLSKGNDPYISAKVDGRSGTHQISVSAKFKGTTSIQIFWTTEADPGTSEEK